MLNIPSTLNVLAANDASSISTSSNTSQKQLLHQSVFQNLGQFIKHDAPTSINQFIKNTSEYVEEKYINNDSKKQQLTIHTDKIISAAESVAKRTILTKLFGPNYQSYQTLINTFSRNRYPVRKNAFSITSEIQKTEPKYTLTLRLIHMEGIQNIKDIYGSNTTVIDNPVYNFINRYISGEFVENTDKIIFRYRNSMSNYNENVKINRIINTSEYKNLCDVSAEDIAGRLLSASTVQRTYLFQSISTDIVSNNQATGRINTQLDVNGRISTASCKNRTNSKYDSTNATISDFTSYIPPLVLKASVTHYGNTDDTQTVLNIHCITRKVVYTYSFSDPSLSNWKVDKVIQNHYNIDAEEELLKQNITSTDPLNNFDEYYIEFRYIGTIDSVDAELTNLFMKLSYMYPIAVSENEYKRHMLQKEQTSNVISSDVFNYNNYALNYHHIVLNNVFKAITKGNDLGVLNLEDTHKNIASVHCINSIEELKRSIHKSSNYFDYVLVPFDERENIIKYADRDNRCLVILLGNIIYVQNCNWLLMGNVNKSMLEQSNSECSCKNTPKSSNMVYQIAMFEGIMYENPFQIKLFDTYIWNNEYVGNFSYAHRNSYISQFTRNNNVYGMSVIYKNVEIPLDGEGPLKVSIMKHDDLKYLSELTELPFTFLMRSVTEDVNDTSDRFILTTHHISINFMLKLFSDRMVRVNNRLVKEYTYGLFVSGNFDEITNRLERLMGNKNAGVCAKTKTFITICKQNGIVPFVNPFENSNFGCSIVVSENGKLNDKIMSMHYNCEKNKWELENATTESEPTGYKQALNALMQTFIQEYCIKESIIDGGARMDMYSTGGISHINSLNAAFISPVAKIYKSLNKLMQQYVIETVFKPTVVNKKYHNNIHNVIVFTDSYNNNLKNIYKYSDVQNVYVINENVNVLCDIIGNYSEYSSIKTLIDEYPRRLHNDALPARNIIKPAVYKEISTHMNTDNAMYNVLMNKMDLKVLEGSYDGDTYRKLCDTAGYIDNSIDVVSVDDFYKNIQSLYDIIVLKRFVKNVLHVNGKMCLKTISANHVKFNTKDSGMYFVNETNGVRTGLIKEFVKSKSDLGLDNANMKKFAVMYLKLFTVFGIRAEDTHIIMEKSNKDMKDIERMNVIKRNIAECIRRGRIGVCIGRNEEEMDVDGNMQELKLENDMVRVYYPKDISDSDMEHLLKFFRNGVLFDYTAVPETYRVDSVNFNSMRYSKSCENNIHQKVSGSTGVSSSVSQVNFSENDHSTYDIRWRIIPVITEEMMGLLNDTFKISNICTPLMEDKMVRHIASIPKYSKINYVDKMLKAQSIITYDLV